MTMLPAQPYHSPMPVPTIPAQRRSSPAAPRVRVPRTAPPVIPAPRVPTPHFAALVAPAPRMAAHRSQTPINPAPRRPASAHRTADPAQPASALPEPTDALGTHRRSRLAATLNMVGQLGSAVSLSALLVVAAAIGVATDGQPVDAAAPLSITFDSAE